MIEIRRRCRVTTRLAALAAALAAHAAAADGPPPADAAARIIGGALTDGGALSRLTELTDGVGPRLTGSAGAAAAVAWAEQRFRADGVSVKLEKVLVPHWVRGVERGQIIARPGAAALELALTALGGSGPTPPGGLTAEVLEVSSLAEVRTLGERARGKILLFQHTMHTPEGYGEFAELRGRGPAEAQKAGAVAALVRSLATSSLRSPHTGATRGDPAAPFPSAALATEDAELLHRLLQKGPLQIHLELGCQTLPDVESANVVAEVRGDRSPDEVVLLGAHLDSWDLAQGAVDDGAGVAIVMEALHLIAREKPHRTVRAVLFMNEENGLRGGEAYAKQHEAEVGRHVAALEADSGSGAAGSIRVHGGAGAAEQLRAWMAPLATLGVTETGDGDAGGADISPLGHGADPVVMVRVHQDGSRYFDLHHSAADTLDKVKPFELAQASAAVAWTAFALAEMERPLPRPPAAKADAH
jgi:hypothetical protein